MIIIWAWSKSNNTRPKLVRKYWIFNLFICNPIQRNFEWKGFKNKKKETLDHNFSCIINKKKDGMSCYYSIFRFSWEIAIFSLFSKFFFRNLNQREPKNFGPSTRKEGKKCRDQTLSETQSNVWKISIEFSSVNNDMTFLRLEKKILDWLINSVLVFEFFIFCPFWRKK